MIHQYSGSGYFMILPFAGYGSSGSFSEDIGHIIVQDS